MFGVNFVGTGYTIKIYNTRDELVATDTNEEELVTSFILPVSLVKEGYRIQISNAFGEILLKSSVYYKDQQN